MTPSEAYREALKEGYSKTLENIACKDPYHAYFFAKDILGANIEKCQIAACKDPYHAYFFALSIPNANIKYCSQFIINNLNLAYPYLKLRPQYLELLKDEPGWKDIITQQMINEYKVSQILL